MKDFIFDIFGSDWRVCFVDSVYYEDSEKSEDWVWGICDSDSRMIRVSTLNKDGDKIPDNEIALTICHEIVHAMFFTGQYFEESDNEKLVEWLGRCLYSLVKQNKLNF